MIQELINKIKIANEAYRVGKPIMSDIQYDILVEELKCIDPHNSILTNIGHTITNDSRKRKLDIDMASMNKLKTIDEFYDWCRLKKIDINEIVVITPKYDGLSLCVNEFTDEATTRGDGTFGQKSDEHYKLIGNHLTKLPNPWPLAGGFLYTYGEVMMPKSTFIEKYSMDYSNPRNLVGGLLNSDDATQALKDTVYIKYGGILEDEFKNTIQNKSELLDSLNQGQEIQVPYKTFPIKDLTHDILFNLFKSWSVDFEIDGLIIEINNLNRQLEIGRDTSTNNPKYAMAYKSPEFEQVAETEILDIEWNISKNSLIKPVAIVNPVNLDGVIVSRCTLNNARFVKDMGIGIGCVVLIRRSGLVIPKIVEVIKPVDFIEPIIDGVDIDWNESGIELIALTPNDSQKLKSIISFFEILECDNVGHGVISQLYNSGYKSIKDILNLSISDLEKIDRFGRRKAKIVFESIQKSIKGVRLSKLQHATNIFVGMGSKKLALLEHFIEKPTIEMVMKIEGFAETSAKTYVDNYDIFFDFIKDLPVTIEEKVEIVKTSNDLEGMVFVFTGIRMKYEEAILESRGAKISSSVSKNTTHLVCKDPNSGSSKLEKAKSLGIKVFGVEDLLQIIN